MATRGYALRMDKNRTVEGPEAWAALPEIQLPAPSDLRAIGSTYIVRKVGFVAASEAQCRAAGLSVAETHAGKCVLPTAVVEFDGEPTLCRLPPLLASWVFDCVALARSGINPFPASVEFGLASGSVYAQFV
jgi:hypothetical protein